jgi:hypothetical protein
MKKRGDESKKGFIQEHAQEKVRGAQERQDKKKGKDSNRSERALTERHDPVFVPEEVENPGVEAGFKV